MLIQPTPWTRTPSQILGLNRANPLTRGLYVAYYVVGSGARDSSRYLPAEKASGIVITGNRMDFDEGDGEIKLGVSGSSSQADGAAIPFLSSTSFSAYSIATPRGLANRRSLFSFMIGNAPVLAMGYTDSSAVFSYLTNSTYLPESAAGTFVDGQRAGFGMTWSSTRASPTGAFFKNGRRTAGVDHSGADTTISTTADNNQLGISCTSNADRVGWQGTQELCLMWNTLLTDSQMAAVHANPWALFAPMRRRFWVNAFGSSSTVLNIFSGRGGNAAQPVC